MNDVIYTLSAPVTVGDFGHPISIDKLELFSISLTMASVTPTLSIVLTVRVWLSNQYHLPRCDRLAVLGRCQRSEHSRKGDLSKTDSGRKVTDRNLGLKLLQLNFRGFKRDGHCR